MKVSIYRIYQVENRITLYIGSTKQFEKRKRDHIKAIKKGSRKGQEMLYNKLREYGENSIAFEIVEEVDVKCRKEVDKIEENWIRKSLSEYLLNGGRFKNYTVGSSYRFCDCEDCYNELSQVLGRFKR